MKTGVSDDVKTGSDHVKPIRGCVSHDFEVLMGAYRGDLQEKGRIMHRNEMKR